MSDCVNLLIEIGVEELPIKAVTNLADAGAELFAKAFDDAGIPHGEIAAFGAPRRLAWRVQALALAQPDQKIERRGPAMKAAKDSAGQWTKAATGFAKSCGVTPDELSVIDTPKGEWLMFYGEDKGQATKTLFPDIFADVMHKLPIAKRMRWSDYEQPFVRPVNTLVVLAGSDVWPLEYFGVQSGNLSQGHRVHHPAPVLIHSADTYEADMQAAYVMVPTAKRIASIRAQVKAAADKLGGVAVMPEGLLKQVASLNEWPVAVVGSFAESFLAVPQEVLITTMQDNQYTFAVKDKAGKLMPNFIAIANLASKDPASVSKGNEKVIRPRFADAEFFWHQDLKRKLEDYLPQLEKVVYQQQLGSIAEKTRRVGKVAVALARITGANAENVATAAKLAKSDLQSEMVMEFTELQGLMGRYYAQHEGLNDEIAYAIEEQYFPVGAGAELPAHVTGTTLAIAEKIDTLVGGFAIGAQPTGSKDPYALRRMAIGLIRLIIENKLTLHLTPWLENSAATFAPELKAGSVVQAVRDYVLDRLEGYYREQGIDVETYQAVRALDGDDLLDFDNRIQALQRFMQGEDAQSLLASAKRIRNILKKNGENAAAVEEDVLQEMAEKALFATWQEVSPKVAESVAAGDYAAALTALVALAKPLETFFTDVMVMADEEALKNNRLALLTALQGGFDKIADLSLLGK